jgi:uncharacterized membrane protein (Fun14 family)
MFSQRLQVRVDGVDRAAGPAPIVQVLQGLLVDLDEVAVLGAITGFAVRRSWVVFFCGGLFSYLFEALAELIFRCSLE